MLFNPKTHCYCAACKTTHRKPQGKRGRPHVVKNQGRNITIAGMHEQGFSMVQIGIKFSMTKQAVSKIIKQHKEMQKEKKLIKQ